MSTDQELTFKSILNGLSLRTLEEISLVTFAVQLMKNEEIKKIYYDHFSVEMTSENNLSDSSVRELTFLCKSLQLPYLLQVKLVECFLWVCEQYFNWIYFLLRNLGQLEMTSAQKIDFIAHIINTVEWSRGVIDKQKSIRQIFLYKNMKTDAGFEMFRIASRFCLKDDLKTLWDNMPVSKKTSLENYCRKEDYITFYWICEMNRDMREFMRIIHSYHIKKKYFTARVDYEDPNIYAFILHIFEGDILGVKYFNELANFNIEHKLRIIRNFIIEVNEDCHSPIFHKEVLNRNIDKVCLLLKDIDDECMLKEIFNNSFQVFLIKSVIHWPWRKFFFPLLRMYGASSDEILSYRLMLILLEDLEKEKADLFEMKMLLKNTPSKNKIEICSFLILKKEGTGVKCFWEKMTVEVLEMFLRDEQLRNILTPHENPRILLCIEAGKYDLIEFWLQKCLVSEEAIASYFQNFIQKQFLGVIKTLRHRPLSSLNKFLDLAFKYEDLMSIDDIIKIKDQVINNDYFVLQSVINCLCVKKDVDDIKKFMDWMVRNRNHEYENEFINWKQKVIEKLFFQMLVSSNTDFTNSLCDFLSYKVNDQGKIKIMMKKANLNENKICSKYLMTDFALIDNYLSFLEGYGKDIFLIKKNFFYYIFNDCYKTCFIEDKFCENIKKLLYWNCEINQEVKAKVEEIKKKIITKGAVEKFICCVHNYSFSYCKDSEWVIAMNDILKFLFEDKIEDEEWSKMLFDLKMKVIEELKRNKYYVWEEEKFYGMMAIFINYGKEHENIREGNWRIKKYLIECLKNLIQEKLIPKWILHRNLVSCVLEGDEARPDFKEVIEDFESFCEKSHKRR